MRQTISHVIIGGLTLTLVAESIPVKKREEYEQPHSHNEPYSPSNFMGQAAIGATATTTSATSTATFPLSGIKSL